MLNLDEHGDEASAHMCLPLEHLGRFAGRALSHAPWQVLLLQSPLARLPATM